MQFIMPSDNVDKWQMRKQSLYYFVNNCIYVKYPVGANILLQTRKYTKVLLNYFLVYDKLVITKSRRMGISDLLLAYALWKMIFGNEKTNILFIAPTEFMADYLKKRIMDMYDNLPEDIKPPLLVNNKYSFVINNGSKFSVMSSNSTVHGIRGQSLSLCVVDEAAFCCDMKNIWSMIYSSILPNGKIIVSSSLNELGDWFDELTLFRNIVDAKYVKLPWHKDPEKDFNWERETRKMLSKRQFARDFECKFIQ